MAGIDSQPRTVDVVDIRAFRQVDFPLRESIEDLVDGEAAFETSQRRAEAVVRAHTEAEVRSRRAVDVENLTVRRELAVISVGGPDQKHHDASLGAQGARNTRRPA